MKFLKNHKKIKEAFEVEILPVVKLTILSEKLATILGFDKKEIIIEAGNYSIEQLIEYLSKFIPKIRLILDSMQDIVLIINERAIYNYKEKINVFNDMQIVIFEVGAGG
jgi:hypothetical protein